MLSQGYGQSGIDHCLYTKWVKDDSLLILIMYVNDMLLASTNINGLATLKSKLNENFDMKDLGDASHILGMCIVQERDKKLLYLSQIEYIEKVLKHFDMEGGKALSTPLPPYVKLCKNDSPKLMQRRLKLQRCHILLQLVA